MQFIFNTKKYLLFWAIIISVCLQMTDIKLFDIKIGEILMLILFVFHFFYIKSIPKYIIWFFGLLIIFLVKTLIQDFFTTFYINTHLPLIKMPGLVSLSRFLEFFCCLIFCLFVVEILKSIRCKDSVYFVVYKLLKYNIYLPSFLFFLFFFLYSFHFLHVNSNFKGFLVYDTTGQYGDATFRLKGLYVEGGPLGLFYSYIFVVYEWILNKVGKKDFLGKFLIILVIILAASKAGYSMLAIYFGVKIFFYFKKKFGNAIAFIVIPLLFFICIGLLYIILQNYIGNMNQDLAIVGNNVTDTNFDGNTLMGRVAGLVIVPNMIKDNFFIGIGLGNYPLVRNNPLYLGYFPTIPTNYWDSSGLGGLIDFLTEGGIFIFLIFVFILIKIYYKINNTEDGIYIFYSFVGPFIFGVQFYFFYPWLSLAFIIFFFGKNKKYNAT